MNDNGNVIGCKFFDYPTCQECEYGCKSKSDVEKYCPVYAVLHNGKESPCKVCGHECDDNCFTCDKATDEQKDEWQDAFCTMSRTIYGECCKLCGMACDGWEAAYCCSLCHEEGAEHCDMCDPWDI